MKYVITERQHRFLIEQEIPNWFKRRFNAANMEKHITNGEINYPTLCDDFGDELLKHVLPALFGEDPDKIIERGAETNFSGKLTEGFQYLSAYLEGKE